MENLSIKATAKTPSVLFNADQGEMLIEGRAIPLEKDEFWAPVLKWFYAYASAPQAKTRFVFKLDYFNISSSRKILFLLHKMNEMMLSGSQIEVEWWYPSGDDEMKEAGTDFSCMVDVPISILAMEETLAQAV